MTIGILRTHDAYSLSPIFIRPAFEFRWFKCRASLGVVGWSRSSMWKRTLIIGVFRRGILIRWGVR